MEDPLPIYVPRDDAYEEGRMKMLAEGNMKAVRRVFVPAVVSGFSGSDFGGFHHVDSLYKEGMRLKRGMKEGILDKLPLISKIQEASEGQLLFDTPTILSSKRPEAFGFFSDDHPPPFQVATDLPCPPLFPQRTSSLGCETTSSPGRWSPASTP